MEFLASWWHAKVLRHEQTVSRVTIGLGDTSRGVLIRCECGKVYAL